MKFRTAILIAASAIALASCANDKSPKPLTPAQRATAQVLEQSASRQVTCTQGYDCEKKWGRAMAWVTKRSVYPVELANDSIIQTSPSAEKSTDSSFVIKKTAQGNGGAVIEFTSRCDNKYKCNPSENELKSSFVNFVGVQ